MSIQSRACELLVQTDENKIGLSYNAILEIIKREFVLSKTTVKCLAWYANHLKKNSQALPVRPRSVNVKPQVVSCAHMMC